MKEINGLDSVQAAFLELTSSIGLTIDEMNTEIKDDGHFEWAIDYENSLGERHEYDLSQLLRYFDIHRKARRDNDQLTAFSALLFAKVSAHNLKNLFENIEDEIDKVMFRDPRFTWPEIPEGYKFPQDYLEAKSPTN